MPKEKILSDRELIADLVRHEFTQFRSTKHGVLWGMRTYRFMTPFTDRANFSGNGQSRHAEARTREWVRLKERIYGDMPGFKERILSRASTLPLAEREQPIIQVISDPIALLAVDPPHLLHGALHAQVMEGQPIPEGAVAASTLAFPSSRTRTCWVCQERIPRDDYDAHIAAHDRETAPPPTPVQAPVVALALPASPTEEEVPMVQPTPTAAHEAEVRAALAASGGNRSAAADALRVSRTTLQRLITEYGISVPLATHWVCPFCRAEFKAQGKHLEFCPAAKAANRARSRMERDRHQQTVARAANPSFVAPHIRAADERVAAPPPFTEAARPQPHEPDFTETTRPEAYRRPGSTPSPFLEAVVRTAETGGAVCLRGVGREEGRRLQGRAEHYAKHLGLKAHVRRVNNDLYLWVDRVTP